jgi:predicted dehydrogenase
MTARILIVGVGFMGKAYAAVLKARGIETVGVGRSAAGATAFETETGFPGVSGGLDGWRARGEVLPSAAIVCVAVDETAAVVRSLINLGMRKILVEKPGATSAAELACLSDECVQAGADVRIAYNRRFYESVAEARRRIEAEGGVESFHFEFTEREKDANTAKFSSTVRRHWALANSSHVIDLAFHLGGSPAQISHHVAGSLPWHPGGSRFAGSGVTEGGALFTYCANWTSGGRWAVELMTRESRLILKPLEQLVVQKRGSFELVPVPLDDALDKTYKPGIYRQTEAFLDGVFGERLLSIVEQAGHAARLYGPMSGEGDGR